ncbi:hypothetical protein FYK55_03150 [Roseiconus nitratireducens]|uniref:Uncharacterized protein n=1 Tax=Roseiconus nitratireducens TaxID=2605748 RepID=A0A5M6DEG2_9BACT|nr:hypothetical protein [Roseiconus nitratireducens]KAA5545924.1 hypothetical protein FYK55_03150 [Roseiconus nitratireducens]
MLRSWETITAMKTKRFTQTLILAALFAFAAGPLAEGQEPDLADAPAPGPIGRMMNGLNPANWQMPKLKMPTMDRFMPTRDEQDRVITKKNSLVDEVSKTAKSSWTRTKDTLNPMKLIPAGFKQNQQTEPAPKEPGFFSRLFFPEPERDTTSVNDFLKQDPIR